MAKQIFLSAGHGAGDPGALSVRGHKEADLALELRDATAAALRAAGADVLEDGRREQNLPLRDALKMAREVDGPKVEIHFNAAGPAASGVEVLCHPQHRRLAQSLARAVAVELVSPLRGDFGWKPANAGQHHRLAFCEAGGLILEVCFITNEGELNTYLAKRQEIAKALASLLADEIN